MSGDANNREQGRTDAVRPSEYQIIGLTPFHHAGPTGRVPASPPKRFLISRMLQNSVLLAAVGSGLCSGLASAANWSISVALAPDFTLGSTDLAIDPQGYPRACYYWNGTTSINYLWKDAQGWHTEGVPFAGYGFDPSIALDSEGVPYIGFDRGGTDIGMAYARRIGTSWSVATINSSSGGGSGPSIAIDRNGRPGMAHYADYAGDDLLYSSFNGSSWSTVTVDSQGNVGASADLAFDSAGRPHISYFDTSNLGVKYAYFTGSTWQVQSVDSGDVHWNRTRIAIDAGGRPHIVYINFDSRWSRSRVKYARHDGSTWQIQTVAEKIGTLSEPCLSLDGNGNPHIAYCDGDQLKYAWYAGSSWQTETVDSGNNPSMAIDASGRLHILYVSNTGSPDELKYAVATVLSTWDSGYLDLGGGWRRLAWFGDYVPVGNGWFWHSRFGYFYASANSVPNGIYLYTTDMKWLFTRQGLYPYLYRFTDQSWRWYKRDSRNPRWFLNLRTGRWERR